MGQMEAEERDAYVREHGGTDSWGRKWPRKSQEARRGPSLAQDTEHPGVEAESLKRAYSVPHHPQTQESLTTQLHALRVAANRLGLYDAADWLRREDV